MPPLLCAHHLERGNCLCQNWFVRSVPVEHELGHITRLASRILGLNDERGGAMSVVGNQTWALIKNMSIQYFSLYMVWLVYQDQVDLQN